MMTERDEAALERAEDDEPIDPDVELTVGYLEGWLPAGGAEEFEERFANDEAFARKVYPLMTIWTAPIDWRAAYEAYKPKMEYPAEPPARIVNGPTPAESVKALRQPRPPRRRPRFLYAWQSRAKRAYFSMGSLMLVGLGSIWASSEIDKRQVQILARQGILAEGALPRGITFEAPFGPPRAVGFGNGSVVVLKAHSRVTYKVGPPPTGLLVILDGEATLKVSRADKVMMVRMSGRQTMVLTGSYAFACEVGCEEMRLTVGTGIALMNGSSRARRVSLTSGQFGRIPRGGEPERTNGGEGYPAISRLGKAAP